MGYGVENTCEWNVQGMDITRSGDVILSFCHTPKPRAVFYYKDATVSLMEMESIRLTCYFCKDMLFKVFEMDNTIYIEMH